MGEGCWGEYCRVLEILGSVSSWLERVTEGEEPTVIRRVFEGGDGCIKAGRSERSSERGEFFPWDDRLEAREIGGVLGWSEAISGGLL